MTNEERDLIARFVARVSGGGQQAGHFASSSVPATQPALPPIDREADQFIATQFQQYPDARYRITQTAFVQEAALAEAQNRIQHLQWELDQAKQAMQQAPQNKGFFGNLFGGGATPQPQPQQRPGGPWGQPQGQPQGQPMGGQPGYGYQPTSAPPQPQYPPNYQPGMFQRGGGSGFLGSALTTAAGVAGGMVVGNALMNAFGGHGASAGSSWASGGAGSSFDGAGVNPTDPTAGFASADPGYGDPFAGGGVEADAGGFAGGSSWDTASNAGFDQGGGGFDGGGGGGFDDNA